MRRLRGAWRRKGGRRRIINSRSIKSNRSSGRWRDSEEERGEGLHQRLLQWTKKRLRNASGSILMNSFAPLAFSLMAQESFEAMMKHKFRRKDDARECTGAKWNGIQLRCVINFQSKILGRIFRFRKDSRSYRTVDSPLIIINYIILNIVSFGFLDILESI